MGMYDSIYGEVPCPKCKAAVEVEIQFKWSDCALRSFYTGERIEPHYSGVMWMESVFPTPCPQCRKLVKAHARLVDGWVEGLYTDKDAAPKLPQVPDVSFRETLYQRAALLGVGNCRECQPFADQPFAVGDVFTAFGEQWTVQEGWSEDVAEEDSIAALMGRMGCNSTRRYVYRVACGNTQRWAVVTDPEPDLSGECGGNVILYDAKPEEHRDYVRTPLEV